MLKDLMLNIRYILYIFITSILILSLSFGSIKILDTIESNNNSLSSSHLSNIDILNEFSRSIFISTNNASNYLYLNSNSEIATNSKNTLITHIYKADKAFEDIKKSDLNNYNYISLSNLSVYYSEYKTTISNLIDAVDNGNKDKTETLYLSLNDISSSISTTTIEITKSVFKTTSEKHMSNISDYNSKRTHLLIFTFLILLVFIFIGIFSFIHTTKVFKKCTEFANKIAEGDLTPRLDEDDDPIISNLYSAMNKATEKIREAISSMRIASTTLNNSSLKLSKVTEEIKSSISSINISSKDIILQNLNDYNKIDKIKLNLDMLHSNMTIILNKTADCRYISSNIKQKTEAIISANSIFSEELNSIYAEKCSLLKTSLEEIKLISSLQKLTDVIYYMSKKSNILAANASIEAARSSENNKCFLIVADEIRKLSIEAFNISTNVHEVIDNVNKNIDNLNVGINEAIDFVDVKIYPQINSLYRNSSSCLNDSKNIVSITKSLDELIETLLKTINDMQESILTMSSLSENSTARSNEILLTVSSSYSCIEDMHNLSLENTSVSENLDKMISYFKV